MSLAEASIEAKICVECNEVKTNFRTKKQCIDCFKIYMKEYRANNKEKLLAQARDYKKRNAEAVSKKKKEWNKKNKEKIKIQRQGYVQKNKHKYAAYMYNRRLTNIPLQMREKYELKVKDILKSKKSDTENHIKSWFEFNFKDGMTWDNHGSCWHIDHVLPISRFDFEDDLDISICFDWKNCMPLHHDANIKKHNKILPHSVLYHEMKLREYGRNNNYDFGDYLEKYSQYFGKMLSNI